MVKNWMCLAICFLDMLGKFTNDNGCLWSSTHQKWFTNWTFTNQNGEIVVMYPINMVKKRGFHEQTLGYHQELQHFWVT